MKPVIFFVEDDENINALIDVTLKRNKFESYGFTDPRMFFDELENGIKKPNLIILDIMLSYMDGYTILSTLKKDERYRDIPVIFLTAKSSETDIVQGLDMGASDYITKPFGLLEFVSRINTNLRKNQNRTISSLKVRDLSLDFNRHVLLYKDQMIPVTSKEFDIMMLLMSNPSVVITRGTLFKNVWGDDTKLETVSSRTLDMHIKFIREKIARYTDEAYIETVRGVGYIINE